MTSRFDDQLDLFPEDRYQSPKDASESLPFGGASFDWSLDYDRLKRSLDRVAKIMSDGKWRTLAEISRIVGSSEAGVSARLRDLRKPEFQRYFGCEFIVDSRRTDSGLWFYRVIRSTGGSVLT